MTTREDEKKRTIKREKLFEKTIALYHVQWTMFYYYYFTFKIPTSCIVDGLASPDIYAIGAVRRINYIDIDVCDNCFDGTSFVMKRLTKYNIVLISVYEHYSGSREDTINIRKRSFLWSSVRKQNVKRKCAAYLDVHAFRDIYD